MKASILFPAALVLAACATATATAPGAPFDPAKLDMLQPGVSTKDDAVKLFGEPNQRMPSLNDHSTLIYDFTAKPDAGAKFSAIKVVLLFDPEGRFVRSRIYGQD